MPTRDSCWPAIWPAPGTPTGGAGGPVHSTRPSATLVRSPDGVQAHRPVRAAADHFAVVIILAVVFPAALAADFIGTALGEGRMTAARAGVEFRPARSKDIPLSHVRVEPSSPALDEFLVREARVIPWPSIYGSLRRVVLHANQYDGEGRKAHICRDESARPVMRHVQNGTSACRPCTTAPRA
jgi:hypothetical protein